MTEEECATTVLKLDGTVAVIKRSAADSFHLIIEIGDRKSFRWISAEIARDPLASPEFARMVAEMKAELLRAR